MRDIVIFGIVVGLALWSLRAPWIGVMNWTWLSLMNPHRYAWGFVVDAPVAAIAAAGTLAGLLVTPDRQNPFKGTPVWWLFLFAIWMTVSWLLGRDIAADQDLWEKVAKIYLMIFVTLALLSTRFHIMVFAAVSTGSIAFLAAKGGIFTVMTGGAHRVWGPKGSFIEGNNEFALAAIMTIPLLHFLQLQLHKPWQRHAITIVMAFTAAAAIGSHSRGALLAIAAMSAVFWWRSSQKGLIGALILLGAVVLLPFMPQEWWERMDTIQTYETDGSAMGRLNAWAVAIGVAKDQFFGSGMGYLYRDYFLQYGIIDDIPRAAHSIYFQVLGNHGFFGLFLFLGILISSYRLAGKLRRAPRDNPDTRWVSDLGGMIQVSLVAYMVGGSFLSLAYFDMPYNLMILAVLANVWLTRYQLSGLEHAETTRTSSTGRAPAIARDTMKSPGQGRA